MLNQILARCAPVLNQRICVRLRFAVKVLRSFLPWRRYAKKSCKGSLDIKVHRQWTFYSCTAAVAQMVAHYYGIKIGHRRAIALTRCRPDGATLHPVARALKRSHGFAIAHFAPLRPSELLCDVENPLSPTTTSAITTVTPFCSWEKPSRAFGSQTPLLVKYIGDTSGGSSPVRMNSSPSQNPFEACLAGHCQTIFARMVSNSLAGKARMVSVFTNPSEPILNDQAVMVSSSGASITNAPS